MKKQILITFGIIILILQGYAQCTFCTIPFVASSQAIGDSVSVVIPAPSGVAENDVMIAAIHAGWCSSGSDITAPDGWTLIGQTSNTGPGCGSINTSIQLATFYKVAEAAEPTSYEFNGFTSQIYVGGIAAYSGVDTSDPINVSGNDGNQEDCVNIVAPDVTTTATCTRLVGVFFCSVNSSLTDMIPQLSLTERVDVGSTGNHPWGNENLLMADELINTSGATGIRSAALSGCDGDSWVTGAQLIALNCEASSSGLDDLLYSDLISISPNPGSGVFNIGFEEWSAEKKPSIEVYNAFGERVLAPMSVFKSSSIDLTNLPKGIYSMKIILPEATVTKKIVLE